MQFQLTYFNGRGLAETSRILFALAQRDYNDYRYPLELIDWASHNMRKEEFDEDKNTGKLVDSMNKLPRLEVFQENQKNVVLFQSKAIERFLATEFDFMGANNIDRCKIDAICETVRDFKTDYQLVRKKDNKEVAMQTWFGETLPVKLALLENVLQDDNFAVGESLSLADVTLYAFCVDFFDDKKGIEFSLRGCPKMRGIVQKMSENEHLQSWIEKRIDTPF